MTDNIVEMCRVGHVGLSFSVNCWKDVFDVLWILPPFQLKHQDILLWVQSKWTKAEFSVCILVLDARMCERVGRIDLMLIMFLLEYNSLQKYNIYHKFMIKS